MKTYKKAISKHTDAVTTKSDAYLLSELLDWCGSKNNTHVDAGRNQFISAFKCETKLLLPQKRKPKVLIEQGYPKNINKKTRDTQ